MPATKEIQQIARQIAGTLTALRRDIHAHPELGFKEEMTNRKITATLKRIGLERIISPVAQTGVIGILQGGKGKGATVGLRADMDALPIREETDLTYKSRHPGVMHACGHDAHVAMLIGAAMILKRLRARFAGQVKFIFQPAEETLFGAPAMVKPAIFGPPKVNAIFALHVDPEIDFGKVSCEGGPLFAAADRFLITITGRGGHAADHYLCVDPISVANHVYDGLRSIERNLHGWDARVISVCSIHGGTAFNIIPAEVTLEGTVRTYDKKVRALIIRRIRELAGGIAGSHGARAKVMYEKGVPATINNSKMAEVMRASAKDLGMPIFRKLPSMGGEDFSHFLQKAPGAMARLGVRSRKNCPSLHNSRFDADDRVLPLGAALLAHCALNYVSAYWSNDVSE